ncbi:MAG: hypothetical protein HY702_01535 [Gemmatimonadetes bacterium]|nr:hypothetical protein [Gemmatimonadota bacterium]
MVVARDLARRGVVVVGCSAVTLASALVGPPDLRTFLVWLGFFPILWAAKSLALQPQPKQKMVRRRVIRVLKESPPPPPPDPAAFFIPDTPVEPELPASDASQAHAPETSLIPTPPPPRRDFAVTRRYYPLRRLTEQFLKEVRRMNMVAAWGREGAIPRRQALNEMREIEARMQGLPSRMKRVAGKPKA